MTTTFSLLIPSFNSGLGAYDKAVVKDASGEIIGKSSQIITKQSGMSLFILLCNNDNIE